MITIVINSIIVSIMMVFFITTTISVIINIIIRILLLEGLEDVADLVRLHSDPAVLGPAPRHPE